MREFSGVLRRIPWVIAPLLCLTCGLPGCVDDAFAAPADVPPELRGPQACAPGELPLPDGDCVPAGLPPDMACPPAEVPLSGGGCRPAGVPASSCAKGFAPDDQGGCAAVLPDAPCPARQMAIPGDRACREIVPCGEGAYGDIPVDATTQYVDQAYPGADSDGTQARPWKSLRDGLAAAAPGGLVAIAAGRYTEAVDIVNKAVRLWGRCPIRVEIDGSAASSAIRLTGAGAVASELHGITVTGAGVGVSASGARALVLDRVWVHDTGRAGIKITSSGGTGQTGVAVSGSLIERARGFGVSIIGSEVTIDDTVLRDGQLDANGQFGHGLHVELDRSTGARSSVALRNSLVAGNRALGMLVAGSHATVLGSVVRDTRPPANKPYGIGIGVTLWPATRTPGSLVLESCSSNGDPGE